MAKTMRCQVDIETRFVDSSGKKILHGTWRKPPAPKIGDDRGLRRPSDTPVARQARRASSAGSPIGTSRSLFPLPARTMTIPNSSSMSFQHSPVSSLTRSPHE